VEVESEVTDSLVAHNLDHLCKTATAAADMTAEVVDNSIFSRVLANGDTSAFVPSTDGLQLIRDKLTDIETDTNELQADWVNTGRLDTLLDAVVTGVAATVAATITNAAGADIAADIIAVKADTAGILTDTGTTLDGKINTIDTNVDAILVDTGTTLDGKINTIDTNVDSILADTDGTDGVAIAAGGIGTAQFAAGGIDAAAIAANAIGASELAADAVTEIWSKVVEDDDAANYTAKDVLSILLSVLAGVTATDGSVCKTPDGTTTRVTATINASQERTAMTLTPST
jgi:hypothetical protein